MKTRLRISANDTIKATLSINGKLCAQVYDSGFTTIAQVVATLNYKLPDWDKGRRGEYYYGILNQDKDVYKSFSKIRK